MQIKLKADRSPVKVVQITDCHLEENAGGDLLGMDTDFSLTQVLELVRRDHSNRDLMLATGDISNQGGVAAYQRFKEIIATLETPVYWAKGNHDIHRHMQQAVGAGNELKKIIHIGGWQLILLDSTVEGMVGGDIAVSELEFLDDAMAQNNKPTLIFLHHHVAKIGSDWLDDQRVANADDFLEIVDKYLNIKGVISGHVHQEVVRPHGDINLYTTPSTCIQFKTDSKDFCLDQKMPGLRWFELYDDGSFKTEVSRVPEQDFHVDFSTKGY